MALNSQQFDLLHRALLSAYDQDSLRIMLRTKLDKRLQQLSLGRNLQAIMADLIETAELEGWEDQLILGAHEYNRCNRELAAFVQQFPSLSVQVSPASPLELLIKRSNVFQDVARWRARLAEIEGQVCAIRARGEHVGTGFLVGPDLLLTNHHVAQALERPAWLPSVEALFDYKALPDGQPTNPGTRYRLAADWLLAWSPLSDVDLQPPPKKSVPASTELDYALIRLEQSAGSQPIGQGDPRGKDARRGWIQMPAAKPAYTPASPLFIVQHPTGRPLQLALDTSAILGLNSNGTRLTYTTNTEHGSSGSPCFDQDWNLIALHHTGDPTRFLWWPRPKFNEGIPLPAILDDLKRQGYSSLLSA